MAYIINKVLILSILFFTYPSLSFSSNYTNNVTCHAEKSPIVELKPSKNKKKRTKTKRKHVNSKFKSQHLLWLIPIAFLGGITLFTVGIFILNSALWMSGLIIYVLLNLFFYALLFSLQSAASKTGSRFEGFVSLYLILITGLINLILAIAFVTLGLIYSIPVFWITGLSIMGFLALTFIITLLLG